MSAQRILHDNGVINVLSNNNYEYQFFIKDHLGNTRVVCKPDFETGGTLKSSPVVLQRSDYYPFGMIHGGVDNQPLGVNENRYLYNGKEYQSRHWAEWTEEDDPAYFAALDWYDYGARFYDAQLGRWHSVDPLADQRSWVSPYNYCQNSPIMRVDPTGALDDNYSVDDDGNVKLEEETDDDFDMLYTKSDWDAGNKDDGLKVNDKSLLPELSKERTDTKGYSDLSYMSSDNKRETFAIFKYVVDNSNVEWSLDGYNVNNKREYVLATQHNTNVAVNTTKLGYNLEDEVFNIHSHPNIPGASGYNLENMAYGDRSFLYKKYKKLKKVGKSYAPHYIYHKPSGVMYNYKLNRSKGSIYIRKIKTTDDFFKNWGVF